MTRQEQPGSKDSRAEREVRLAAQLRENLKRRKAQARARTNAEHIGKAQNDAESRPDND